MMNGCKEENKYSWKIVKRSDWRLVENDKNDRRFYYNVMTLVVFV